MREEQYIDIQCVGIKVYLDVSLEIENTVEDPRNGLMPSIFPRITAAIFVLLLIGSIALVSIGAVALLDDPDMQNVTDPAQCPGCCSATS